jgi:hypothetical protein
MPLVGLRDPQTLEVFDLKNAVEHFEEAGLVPREITALVAQEGEGRINSRPFISPSIMDPGSTCRRQMMIERYLDYVLDIHKVWAAKEGGVWHDAFASIGAGDDWYNEYMLPPQHKGRTVKRMEIFPGVWIRGIVDRAKKDWSEVHDFKTTKPAKKDYGLKQDWKVQVNIYARMIEQLYGVKPKMYVWRMIRGSYEPSNVFRKFSVPELTDAEWAKVQAFSESLVAKLEACEALVDEKEAIKMLIKNTPMDGIGMFGNKKCELYCAVQEQCYSIEGIPTF